MSPEELTALAERMRTQHAQRMTQPEPTPEEITHTRDYGPWFCVRCHRPADGTRRGLANEGWALTPLHDNVYCPDCKVGMRRR